MRWQSIFAFHAILFSVLPPRNVFVVCIFTRAFYGTKFWLSCDKRFPAMQAFGFPHNGSIIIIHFRFLRLNTIITIGISCLPYVVISSRTTLWTEFQLWWFRQNGTTTQTFPVFHIIIDFFKLEPQAGFEPTSRFRIRITNPAESSTVSLGQIEFSFDDKGTSILQLKSIYWGLHVPPTELYMSVPCVACPIYKSQPTSSLVGFNNTLAIFLARAVGKADRRDSHSSYSFKAV